VEGEAVSFLHQTERYYVGGVENFMQMAYNTKLEERIDNVVAGWAGINKMSMFGGIGYLLNGNMCFGIHKDYLIVRMDREASEKKLKSKHVELFDITGRPMKGWVMVAEPGWETHADLVKWLDLGRDFALTLPPKTPGQGKRMKGQKTSNP
jgi:TfoX/Sxy family transcriptional regulator of competence genes